MQLVINVKKTGDILNILLAITRSFLGTKHFWFDE